MKNANENELKTVKKTPLDSKRRKFAYKDKDKNMANINDAPAHVREAFARQMEDQQRRRAERPNIEREGEAALRRLFDVAQRDSGQCRYVAAFLLGCYNGQRFPFDLTDFRGLDGELFDDCIAVLKMDAQPRQEVHTYFENGGAAFEKLAADWGITDHLALRRQGA